MNRNQRRALGDDACLAKKFESPLYLNAHVYLHGAWTRKAKPFGHAYLREFEAWRRDEQFQNILPFDQIDRALELNTLVLLYPTPNFTEDQMVLLLNAVGDFDSERASEYFVPMHNLSVDEDKTLELHERVMCHIYGRTGSTFKKGRICTCKACYLEGTTKSEFGESMWRVTGMALYNTMDLHKYVPPHIQVSFKHYCEAKGNAQRAASDAIGIHSAMEQVIRSAVPVEEV